MRYSNFLIQNKCWSCRCIYKKKLTVIYCTEIVLRNFLPTWPCAFNFNWTTIFFSQSIRFKYLIGRERDWSNEIHVLSRSRTLYIINSIKTGATFPLRYLLFIVYSKKSVCNLIPFSFARCSVEFVQLQISFSRAHVNVCLCACVLAVDIYCVSYFYRFSFNSAFCITKTKQKSAKSSKKKNERCWPRERKRRGSAWFYGCMGPAFGCATSPTITKFATIEFESASGTVNDGRDTSGSGAKARAEHKQLTNCLATTNWSAILIWLIVETRALQ